MNSARETFEPSRRDVLRLISSAALGAPLASSAAIADQGVPQLPNEGVFERQLGFTSLEDFIAGFWEKRYARRDANNLLSMLRTWQLNDLGGTPGFGGSLERALGAIKAKASVMAGQTDLYFTPADIEADAAGIPGARFRVIPSLWGHMAGAGLNPTDSHFIETEIRALLAA